MTKKINSFTIKKAVESVFNTKLSVKTRKRDVIYMRCIYYKLCRDLTFESLNSIGKQVNRDHATVLHGLKTFDNIINEFWEKEYFNVYNNLKTNYNEISVYYLSPLAYEGFEFKSNYSVVKGSKIYINTIKPWWGTPDINSTGSDINYEEKKDLQHLFLHELYHIFNGDTITNFNELKANDFYRSCDSC